MRFRLLKWIIEKNGLDFLKGLCERKWFKKWLDNYLKKIVTKTFKSKKYKCRQNEHMLAVGPKKGYWEYVVKVKKISNKKLKLHMNYKGRLLLDTGKYHVVKMRRK